MGGLAAEAHANLMQLEQLVNVVKVALLTFALADAHDTSL